MFRELARKKQELPQEVCIDILRTEKRGVLAVNGEGGYPYAAPMNHFYCEEDGCVYFHCGPAGHRVDALRQDGRVSFCVHDGGAARAGQWALEFRSVIVFGRVEILTDTALIADIVTRLSHKFTDDDDYIRREIASAADHTLLLRLVPEHICGKQVTEE